jgi:lysophospholipase L1-like esterase
MLLAAKLALGPVLLPQAVWVRRTAQRLPEAPGPREGVAGHGPRKLNLLVVGDSSAAGVGLADQSQALALPLADALAQRLKGEVAWQLIARTGVNTSEARALLALSPLPPADVVVTALGVNDVSSQVPRDEFLAQTAGLWSDLRQRSGARWAVLSGLPPMHMLTAVPHPLRWYLGRYAALLDSALRDWTGREGLGYCTLRWTTDPAFLAQDGFHPGPALYPQWAQRLAGLIVSGQERWAGS